MASNETCIQIDSNTRNVGGRTMFYMALKVSENRIKVVTYGRIVYMTNEEYAHWESTISFNKNTTDEQS